MITLSTALPALSSEHLTLYCTRDALLDNLPVLVFYGPATTGNVTHNSSRIQAHIYSLAGFQSFPRLTIAPSSPLYAAVNHLPADQQGDETSRGLAVSLLSYFAGLSKGMKTVLRDRVAIRCPNRVAPMMFDEMHAGDLAASMEYIEDKNGVAKFVESALSTQVLSWVDMDVILPQGTIQRVKVSDGQDLIPQLDDAGLPLYHYGRYSSLVESLGSPAFCPTSTLQRAPSKPTAHSKSRNLTKDQKIALRKELCELVDTEGNYIQKIKDLDCSVATGFGQNASPSVAKTLFPSSLSDIVRVNADFHDQIQTILDETENEAIRDIEGNNASGDDLGSPVTQGRRRDPTGATHIAKALIRWFPKFATPYQDYLRASPKFSIVIGQILEEDSTQTAAYLQEFGEQRLRSALIEPVQRLPRYSLLIDNVISLLPASHPALSSFLKARDLIADICTIDVPRASNATRSIRALREIVHDWPVSLTPTGRLITAVDVVELDPPYDPDSKTSYGILLLFADVVALLRKNNETSFSARGIIAEMDRPIASAGALSSSAAGFNNGLVFLEAFDLFDLRFSESEDSRRIRMNILGQSAPILSSTSNISRVVTKVYTLLNSYDGKVARFSEDVVKARTEGRFSETVRNSEKWALRSINPSNGNLGILLTLSEESQALTGIGRALCQIQLSVDGSKDTRSIIRESRGLEIAACITATSSDIFRLETEGFDGSVFVDDCAPSDVKSVLLTRLANIVRLQSQAMTPMSIPPEIMYNEVVLEKIPCMKEQELGRTRSFRPLSPVKMLANLLGGASSSQPNTLMKPCHTPSVVKDTPLFPPPVPTKTKFDKPKAQKDGTYTDKDPSFESAIEAPLNPLALLEDTLVAYIVALRSRSGNVVGRILRSRAAADELAVNELYNILLEEPNKFQAAAEVSVDVLFASFEKFLGRAWKEHMGPLLPTYVVQSMQSSFDSGQPVAFKQQVKKSLDDMSPQNRRAFTSIMNLLLELLDASGNDGDRGALTASFAEALIYEGNPHDYILLLDRLVDDYDELFSDTVTGPQDVDGFTGSLTRTRSFNTGSISSNASSLRKKFGFGTLTRENSKNESESKVTSIWRTLSKNAKSAGDSHSQPPSLSKSPGFSLNRSKSTDNDVRMLPPLRPVSREKATTSDPIPREEARSRPGSSHLYEPSLSRIGENTPTKPTAFLKKKRRSSLSDLRSLHEPDPASAWSPLQPRKLPNVQDENRRIETPTRTPSPVKQSPTQQIKRPSPQTSGLPRRFGSPQRKENSPMREISPQKASSPRAQGAQGAVNLKSDKVVITTYSPQNRKTSHSGIPLPKDGLSERKWPPNGQIGLPQKTTPSAQKLRMQSPQKIRERLSQEQKKLAISDESFQAEMTKIGEEMATYKIQGTPVKPRPIIPSSRSAPPTSDLDSLSSQLKTLSTNLSRFTETQKASLTSISSDVESSLIVSEKKARKLDELYREANAENEALYERFNDELGRILGKVRGGQGLEEMRGELKEAQDEVVKLKRENGKLRREAVGLRSLLKGE